MSIWDFMDKHWFVALVLICVTGGTITAPARYAFLAWNRHCRSKNIALRGWPTNPLMDADGDIVHPKTEE